VNEIWVWSIDGMMVAGEISMYLEKSVLQCHFVHQKYHVHWPPIELLW